MKQIPDSKSTLRTLSAYDVWVSRNNTWLRLSWLSLSLELLQLGLVPQLLPMAMLSDANKPWSVAKSEDREK